MRHTRRGFLVSLLVLATLLMSLSWQAFAGSRSVSKSYMQNLYVNYLKEEGYTPEIDEDGDVRFKYEGKIYFIQVLENDPEYFRLVLANIYVINGDDDRRKVMAAIDKANGLSKGAKAFTVKDRVWVSIENFVQEPEHFAGIFKRSLSALKNGMDNVVGGL